MDQGLPFISIIIPTYNRPYQLRNISLPALARLDYPVQQFQVIIVDDGGRASLSGTVSEFAGRLNMQLVRQAHSGPAVARNKGASMAQGRFLAFTDDDCAPTADWLQAIARRFAANPACAVGGRTLNALPNNPYAATCQLLIDYLYNHYNKHPNTMRFFTSNNLALPAEHFRDMGGFNEIFSIGGEDRELCYRWTHLGFSLLYAPEVQVHHWHDMSLPSFLRQHFRYGIGAFRFRKVIAELHGEPMQIERPDFYFGLLRCALSQKNRQAAISQSVLIGCSQLATTFGYLWKSLSF